MSDPENKSSDANDAPQATGSLSLIAGFNSEGEPIVEQVAVSVLPNKAQAQIDGAKQYRLEKSPVFVRNLATGDTILFPSQSKAGFDIVKRSGNLSIRVFNKGDIQALSQWLTPELELLDGTLEVESPHILSYSIHVSIGFSQIEALLDRAVGQFPNTVWYYGNVYDPDDGVSPLNWWQEFLAPV
ncbi:MAG: DUF4265 domain-containing protein [Pseudohongiellaceae bacterium]|nr:DUF4265 domain-containing protein [Pseudohongiellaceae bacterium]